MIALMCNVLNRSLSYLNNKLTINKHAVFSCFYSCTSNLMRINYRVYSECFYKSDLY